MSRTAIIDGIFITDSWGRTQRGRLLVELDDEGIWRSGEGDQLSVQETDSYGPHDKPYVAIVSEDEAKQPFIPDPGELQRVGMEIDCPLELDPQKWH